MRGSGRFILLRSGRALWTGVLVGMVGAASLYMSGLRRENLTGQAYAIDGNSLRLGGVEIRLEGLDAPEYRQACQVGGHDVACGHAARDALAGWLARGPVLCALGGTDRYGRKLGHCSVAGSEINRELVRAGQAIASGDYRTEEAEARTARRGIWATSFESPADWRAQHPRPVR